MTGITGGMMTDNKVLNLQKRKSLKSFLTKAFFAGISLIGLSSFVNASHIWKNNGNIISMDVLETGEISFEIGDQVNSVTTSWFGYAVVPYNWELVGWEVTGDASGSIVVDIRQTSYADFTFTPASGTSIAGTEKPTLSSQQKNTDTSISSWSAGVKDNYVYAVVESVSGLKFAKVVLKVKKKV